MLKKVKINITNYKNNRKLHYCYMYKLYGSKNDSETEVNIIFLIFR